jgi:hypothetical protein
MDFHQAYHPSDAAERLICQSLPFFGASFVQKALQTLPEVNERRQARLVFSIAKTGLSSLPWLLQLLEHPSANVRAAAIVGLAEAIHPGEGYQSPLVLQLHLDFVRGPQVSQEEANAFLDKMEAVYDSSEADVPVHRDVLVALTRWSCRAGWIRIRGSASSSPRLQAVSCALVCLG